MATTLIEGAITAVLSGVVATIVTLVTKRFFEPDLAEFQREQNQILSKFTKDLERDLSQFNRIAEVRANAIKVVYFSLHEFNYHLVQGLHDLNDRDIPEREVYRSSVYYPKCNAYSVEIRKHLIFFDKADSEKIEEVLKYFEKKSFRIERFIGYARKDPSEISNFVKGERSKLDETSDIIEKLFRDLIGVKSE